MKKIRQSVLLFLSLIFFVGSLLTVTLKANPVQWILCTNDFGKLVLKTAQTDYLAYITESKSVLGEVDGKDSVQNVLMTIVGINVGQDTTENNISLFEKVGFSGLKYTSYRGEWKYYDVDPCNVSDKTIPESSNYGQFYAERKEPLSTYNETGSSVDNRSKLFQQGTLNAISHSFLDGVNNVLIDFAEVLISLTIAFVSLTFTDFAGLIGLSTSVIQDNFSQLYHNLFLPLSVVAFFFTAIYIIYKGIIRGEVRNALVNGFAKTLLVYFLAIFLSVMPNLLAIPKQIALVGQAVVVSTLTDSMTDDKKQEMDICYTETGVSTNVDILSEEYMNNLTKNIKAKLGCSIWREFLFKPLIVGQFNTPYNELNTLDNENFNWVGKPQVSLGNRLVENWGAFYVSTLSGHHQSLDGINGPLVNNVHKDYYRIVDALSNYDEKFIQSTDILSSNRTGDSGAGSWQVNGTQANYVARTLFKIWTEKYGLSGSSAAGILGNVLQESHFDPYLIEAEYGQSYSARGYGLYQFTPGTKYLNSNHFVPGASLDNEILNQTRFVVDSEIRNGAYRSYLSNCQRWFNFNCSVNDLLNANDPERAMLTFFAVYERGDTDYMNYSARLGAAQWVYENWGKDIQADPSKWPVLNENFDTITVKPTQELTNDGIGMKPSELDYTQGYVEPLEREVLPQWNYFIGNRQDHRFAYTLLILLFSVVGVLPILTLSMIGIMIGVSLEFFLMLLPVFMLFGIWAGQGQSIFIKYLGSIASMMIKKIVVSFILVLSILLMTAIMELANSVGLGYSVVMLIVLVVILLKNKDKLISSLAQVNLAQLTPMEEMKGVQNLKRTTKDTSHIVGAGVVGGVIAEKQGGSFIEGVQSGSKHVLANKLYQTDLGRRIVSYKELNRKDGLHKDKHCVMCGITIEENTLAYSDEYGGFYCEDCALALNFEGLQEAIQVDNEEDSGIKVTKGEKINLDGETINHTNYHALNKLGYASPNGITEEQLKDIEKEVEKSKRILAYDMERVRKTPKGKLTSMYIPEPLRGLVNPQDIKRCVILNDITTYEKLMLEGWDKFAKNLAEKRKLNIEKGADNEDTKQNQGNSREHSRERNVGESTDEAI